MDVRKLAAVGRCLRADILPAAATAAVLFLSSTQVDHEWVGFNRRLDGVGYLLLAAAAAVVLLRRYKPLVMLAAESVLVSTYLAAGYPNGPPPVPLPLAVAAFSVGARLPAVPTAVAAGAAGVTVVGGELIGDALADDDAGWTHWAVGTLGILWLAVPALIGGLLQVARRSAAQAEGEAQRARVEQERLRLYREVHDVVGHGLSVISLQAGVALHVFDRRPEQARAALEAIRRTSHDALEELRATLALTRLGVGFRPGQDGTRDSAGVLTDGSENAGWSDNARHMPLTGLARLDGMLAQVRRAGLPVDLVTSGEGPEVLPAEVDLAVFRVIQESLTNVLRHAGPARARVEICYEPDQVVVRVCDEPVSGQLVSATPAVAAIDAEPGNPEHLNSVAVGHEHGHGHGLRGLRERAVDLGGTVIAGPRPDHGWQVRAVLPLRRAST
ncbi:sensor histidine kinase [Candidatus Protofrankia californiensis]|uniref:sensor histidine kinase n=1 Tax=Candidatus Protofrankia californiensis TaxID=1839754 RepID=UPI0010411679|nr:histidine kinase [Candidatus Protofrankia californiensis]